MLLPVDNAPQHNLDCLLVADQVVVDDERNFQPLRQKCFEFAEDLLARFQSWPAAERDDDVAELALKRTAAGKLNAAEQVMAHFEQIVARYGHRRHVGFSQLAHSDC